MFATIRLDRNVSKTNLDEGNWERGEVYFIDQPEQQDVFYIAAASITQQIETDSALQIHEVKALGLDTTAGNNPELNRYSLFTNKSYVPDDDDHPIE